MLSEVKQNNQISEPIARYEFARSVRMADTDATGFAHFASYVRMMEETEYAFLRSRGLSVVLYDARGTMGFPRLSAEIEIHRPLSLGEHVTVRLSLVSVDGKQIAYQFEVMDDQQVLSVEGKFTAAFCRFPDRGIPYAMLIPESVMFALTQGHLDQFTSGSSDSTNTISLTPCQKTSPSTR
ncbi:MAG: acyl-CoA thioesterase [Planctomycetota bacterium]